MHSVVVRVRKENIRKDFYFANTGEAANFENHLLENTRDLSYDNNLSIELLSRDIDSSKISKDPRVSAKIAYEFFYGNLEN